MLPINLKTDRPTITVDRQDIRNTLSRFPFSGAVYTPRISNIETGEQLIEWLDALAVPIARFVSESTATSDERDRLLRQRDDVRDFLGTARDEN